MPPRSFVITVLLALVVASAGCLTTSETPSSGTSQAACPTESVPSGGDGPHHVHVRIWTEAAEDACVNVQLDADRVVSDVVETDRPEPGRARDGSSVPAHFGTFPWSTPRVTLTVTVPAWDVEHSEELTLHDGWNYLVIEVREDGVQVVHEDEDHYANPD